MIRPLGQQSAFLPGAVAHLEEKLLRGIDSIAAQSPFRAHRTPGGARMSVEQTSCGVVGWISDARGYRYSPTDPLSDRPWPSPPAAWFPLARQLAATAGFPDFAPDTCLINRYAPSARMGLHQDRDEASFDSPIVSISLGASARFAFGGMQRSAPVERFDLHSGDVVVWGGVDRLRFHGVDRLLISPDPVLFLADGTPAHTVDTPSHSGEYRYNLTFRRAC